MKSTLLCMFLVLIFQNLNAQTFCKKTSINFDFNKDELKAESKVRLDSLEATMVGSEFLLELYGFSDSTASAAYNLDLSQRRINSVKKYITSKNKSTFRFFETNLGEEQQYSKVKDMEIFRRVDVFVIPLQNNQITISSGKEQVTVPSDYFEPCGVCQSRPKINSYYTEAEANRAGIQLQTTTGEALETAGTFNFDFQPCNGQKKKRDEMICFQINAAKIDPEMTLWDPDTINGQVYWKESKATPEFDTVNKFYRFCAPGRTINIDKPRKVVSAIYYFPIEFDSIRTDCLNLTTMKYEKTHLDSLITDTNNRIASYGYINGKIYYLNKDLRSFKATKSSIRLEGTRNAYLIVEHIVKLSDYKAFNFTDQTLKLKFKTKPEQIGFYLKDVQLFVPIESNPKDKFTLTNMPEGEFELAYLKKGKLYVIPYKKIKKKYKKKQNLYKLKYTSKNIRLFRREKSWPEKQKEWQEYWIRVKQ